MRLQGLDIFRGVAIVLMVIFHFCFDLKHFGYADFDLKHDDFWRYFRYLIVSMFIFSAGISTQLTHENGINKKKLVKKVLILSIASLGVSLGSYTQFPATWIYFGVLHFFLIVTVMSLPLLKSPKISLFLAILIILGYNMSWINMHWLYNFLQKPFYLPIGYTQDLISIIPWFSAYLFGIVFAYYRIHNRLFQLRIFKTKHIVNNTLSFFGRHSFVIYLSHQIALFSLFYCMKIIL
ncbi:DUF1624 domain-containing protein [Sulfurimonas sp. SAG-AH-194-C20]|nr:heparan-alpha-glucosaminide N-acetyltransferase [Sulfurimonas sp. SAG-AH-194-C20]MDF1878501.1 DUF1624 domain-containing protein [Sulfurimonas sp. SAG-AH-194-C20]